MISDPLLVDPRSPSLSTDVELLPNGPGVYTINVPGTAPHIGSCAFLRARVRRLLGMRVKWEQGIESIHCWPVTSKLENTVVQYVLARRFHPRDFERKLRLRMPWFVGLAVSDRFPRIYVSHRLTSEDPLYGPFPSRDAAQAYAENVASLFQIRKCADPLTPSPEHPGCIYGEMNQCLRPCQCATSDEEYESENKRAADFLRTNGTAARTSLMLARERASEQMDFEAAAHLHKRLERVQQAIALRDEPVGEITSFGGVAVVPSPHSGAVRLWPMQSAVWLQPIDMPLATGTSESRSLDARVRELLVSAMDAQPADFSERTAHLALLLRWYRSSWRDGEWVPQVLAKGISYRKVASAISKLAKAAVTGDEQSVVR